MEIAEPWHETLIHRHKLERRVMEWGDLTLLVAPTFMAFGQIGLIRKDGSAKSSPIWQSNGMHRRLPLSKRFRFADKHGLEMNVYGKDIFGLSSTSESHSRAES